MIGIYITVFAAFVTTSFGANCLNKQNKESASDRNKVYESIVNSLDPSNIKDNLR